MCSSNYNRVSINREFDSLSPHDVRGNCKKAFDAGEALGIPRVIEPTDMDLLTVPDKLAVMTYLYQLRAHFTGEYKILNQIVFKTVTLLFKIDTDITVFIQVALILH